MKKKTDVFNKLDNVLGNYQDNKATLEDVLNVSVEVNKYLTQHAHPHDCFLGSVSLTVCDVIWCEEDATKKLKDRPLCKWHYNKKAK